MRDLPSEYALANVTCEYEMNTQQTPHDSGTGGRRVRRSEEILRQAAEYVSRGETFQNVSLKFDIPISTIRFYMARKGILPRRKRGRTAMFPCNLSNRQTQMAAMLNATSAATLDQQHYRQQLNESIAMAGEQSIGRSVTASVDEETKRISAASRSPSPSGPPFHFANYKLPDLQPNLL
uniref:HTH psq-type domain-containing protein n=1 Tax=Anopheles farauti TaxID=69004 RepID=A0A182Q3I7_9DIPT